MTVAYPHQVQVERAGATAGTEDRYGRDVPGAVAVAATLDAWVQSKRASEQEILTEAGTAYSSHTVFTYDSARVIRNGDTLVTTNRGGQVAGVRHNVLGVRDPDGTGHHLEIDTEVVTRVPA